MGRPPKTPGYASPYYARNRVRIAEYHRAYYAKNRERIRARVNEQRRAAYVAIVPKDPPLTKLGTPNLRFIGRKWGVQRFDRRAYTRAYGQLPERKAARLARYKERGPRPRPGWTRELRAQTLLEQGGNCAICGATLTKACQDHDARTNKPRGLLCVNCNHLIGKAKDSIETLERAVDYLRKYA